MGRPKKARGGYSHAHRAAAATAAAGGAYAAAEAYAAAACLVPKLEARVPGRYGDEEEDEDSEEADFRREAAEMLKQRQQKAALPGGLSQKQLDNAISAFVSQTGVEKSQAEDALLSTAEQYCKDFEE